MFSTPQYTYNEAAGQTAGFDSLDSSSVYPFNFESCYPADWGMQFQEHNNSSAGGGLSATAQQQQFSNQNQNQSQSLFGGSSRTHQRNFSESTINSAGPSSPFTSSYSNPFIASSEQSPRSQLHFDESPSSNTFTHTHKHAPATPSQLQHYSTIGYTPSQASHTPAVHLDMAHMAMDQHNATPDEMPDFSHSSHQSVSSRGQDSPSTPPMENLTADNDNENENDGGSGERPALYKIDTNGEAPKEPDILDLYLYLDQITDYRQTAPRVELFRTESAAAADELYNPEFTQPSATTSASLHNQTPNSSSTNNTEFLSPNRNLVQDRIRTANSVRSQSPQQSAMRAKSPFRNGSPLAPTESVNPDGFKSPSAFFASAADARRQQIEEASARERDRHNMPQLHREATKTMSPRDAVLDYEMDANADMPLFPDTMPVGYDKHVGPSEFFTTNFINNAANQDYSSIATTQAQQQAINMGAFRPQDISSASTASPSFGYMAPQQQQLQQKRQPQKQQQSQQIKHQQQATQPSGNPYGAPQYRAAPFAENTPDFPAHLASMESSVSDAPVSSQGSAASESAVQRPQDTSAATGGYTCTFHNCVQRFDSSAKLQKHKREVHRTSRDVSTSLSSAPTTTRASANPSVSPDPSNDGSEGSVASVGSGMTSAALAARNSQAGPHKCTRINPSTGKPCNTIFSRPYDLTRHEDTIHNRQKVKVRCEYCREEKTFSRNDALTRHMRVVHPDVPWEVKRGRGGRNDLF